MIQMILNYQTIWEKYSFQLSWFQLIKFKFVDKTHSYETRSFGRTVEVEYVKQKGFNRFAITHNLL